MYMDLYNELTKRSLLSEDGRGSGLRGKELLDYLKERPDWKEGWESAKERFAAQGYKHKKTRKNRYSCSH